MEERVRGKRETGLGKASSSPSLLLGWGGNFVTEAGVKGGGNL